MMFQICVCKSEESNVTNAYEKDYTEAVRIMLNVFFYFYDVLSESKKTKLKNYENCIRNSLHLYNF